MSRLSRWPALWLVVALFAMGAGPPSPSYVAVQKSIQRIREAVQAGPNVHGPGWETYCASLEQELKAFGAAESEDARLKSLGKIYQLWGGLRGTTWAPASELGGKLQTWLQPRIALAWASRRMVESIQGMPPTADVQAQGWREGWVDFAGARLNSALHLYESAGNATQRVEALGKINKSLAGLQSSNQSRPWQQSLALQKALNDLFSLPNLDATVDASTLSTYLAREVVEPGPVWFKGQLSYVTPGAYTGFGLLPSDRGIAFYNKQLLTSVTPIRGFQDQIASDQQGRRAAKLYQFNATTQDNSELTVTAVLGQNGISVQPSQSHNVNAAISSDPIPGFGKGMTRLLAGMVGMNQPKITQKVYDGAIGQIREQVEVGAIELGQIKAAEGSARENARLVANLPGDGTLHAGPVLVSGLDLRSQPTFARIGGTVQWQGAADQRGADMPQPPQFADVPSGVGADVHLASAMSNLINGYLDAPDLKDIRNMMVLSHKIPEGAKADPAFEMLRNVEYSDFAKAVVTAQAANDPKELAVRLQRPGKAPDFTSDTNGNLILVLRDFVIEVPAPKQQQGGGLGALLGGNGPPPLVYRVRADSVEIALSFRIDPATDGGPLKFSGRIESVDFGPATKVEQVGEKEEDAREVGALVRSGALAIFSNRLRGQPIDVPLANLRLPEGFVLQAVSPLDPTGWIRLVLRRG